MSKLQSIVHKSADVVGRIYNKNFIPCVGNWFHDDNNLYKLNIKYQDDILEDKQEIPKPVKYYEQIDIELEKINRHKFIRENRDYCFDLDLDYFKVYVSGSRKINTRKRTRNENPNLIDWGNMVSPSSLRGIFLDDPILTYFKVHNINYYNGKTAKHDSHTLKLFDIGNEYEQKVIEELENNFEINKVGESYQARDIKLFEKTRELIKQKKDIIYQPVLHDYENKIFGCPDLIIRIGSFNKIFNQDLLGETIRHNYPDNYVVVDIKSSTLPFNADFTTLRNQDSFKAYKGQLYLYNLALSKLQKYIPDKAFILGKKFTYKKEKGFAGINKLGVIDYRDKDSSYKKKFYDAVDLYFRIKKDGKNWNIETHEELAPNMKNHYDSPYTEMKKDLAKKRKELTQIFYVGPQNRYSANQENITKLDDKNLNSQVLGFGPKSKRGVMIDKILQVYHGEEMVQPNFIKTKTIDGIDWRFDYTEKQEIYFDIETFNPGNKYDPGMIFQMGIGWYEKEQFKYQYYYLKSENKDTELNLIKQMLKHCKEITQNNNKNDFYLVHYCNHERQFINSIYNYAKTCGSTIEIPKYLDLHKLFTTEPITVKRCLNFKLKSITNCMTELGLINVKWDDNSKCSNGLQAMTLAEELYQKGKVSDKDPIMKDIIYYNKIDCLALGEILTYLRNNH